MTTLLPPSERPPLPLTRLNPQLTTIPADSLVVKYQTIVREGNEIVVGRVKVPTPEGHAFVLRRYDTGAFSLTTMFKACFPGATEPEEKVECDYVRSNYNNAGANGGKNSDAVRLAGTWIVELIAKNIAVEYNIVKVIEALAAASPDPGQQYRKSQRSQAAAVEISNTPKKASVEPSTKKTRTSSVEPSASLPLLTNGLPTPSPTKAANELKSQIERELQEGKDLVAKVKKDQEAKAAELLKQAEDSGVTIVEEVKKVVKRGLEDGEEAIEEAAEGVLEEGRAIATNSRAAVPQGRAVQTIKQAAWGAFVFGVGLGATTVLPRLFF